VLSTPLFEKEISVMKKFSAFLFFFGSLLLSSQAFASNSASDWRFELAKEVEFTTENRFAGVSRSAKVLPHELPSMISFLLANHLDAKLEEQRNGILFRFNHFLINTFLPAFRLSQNAEKDWVTPQMLVRRSDEFSDCVFTLKQGTKLTFQNSHQTHANIEFIFRFETADKRGEAGACQRMIQQTWAEYLDGKGQSATSGDEDHFLLEVFELAERKGLVSGDVNDRTIIGLRALEAKGFYRGVRR
jgi:hypothetical protein